MIQFMVYSSDLTKRIRNMHKRNAWRKWFPNLELDALGDISYANSNIFGRNEDFNTVRNSLFGK